ncbi:O-glucosyltransferase rumi homolog [Jatropha curcas]|nr:O-glucosyltransferase rumi homolog [Jatropha curcas]
MLISMADKLETFRNLYGNQISSHLSTACRALKRLASATVFLFFILLVVGVFILRIDVSVITKKPKSSIEFQLKCPKKGIAKTCDSNYTVPFETPAFSDAKCPEYFRWIHEDLRPWKSSGISRDTLETARKFTDFRLVIVQGKLYVEQYQKSFQTRDLFTIWGFLQLLRLYPGRVPDLELMFRCGDIPIIQKRNHQGPNATLPPPLFQYCGHRDALDIVFPDWSFWGWAETNIKPWENTLEGIIKGSKKIKWKNRVPYAYWKGNPYVTSNRGDLMRCNVADKHDWNARLYRQDWAKERKEGYNHSKLEDQCTHSTIGLLETQTSAEISSLPSNGVIITLARHEPLGREEANLLRKI